MNLLGPRDPDVQRVLSVRVDRVGGDRKGGRKRCGWLDPFVFRVVPGLDGSAHLGLLWRLGQCRRRPQDGHEQAEADDRSNLGCPSVRSAQFRSHRLQILHRHAWFRSCAVGRRNPRVYSSRSRSWSSRTKRSSGSPKADIEELAQAAHPIPERVRMDADRFGGEGKSRSRQDTLKVSRYVVFFWASCWAIVRRNRGQGPDSPGQILSGSTASPRCERPRSKRAGRDCSS